ncbi:variant erythrocyte surface antigen-1 family protein [Babesia caballi]|uniref:Variant erythrocyte surface antigen-1 family protein n=1 Tax=Babesia caballi TaxID=5871 RepID=A0AAV4LRG8_BABCB|nr:variant erythrocyte surface antigen-1 family protein [Babesia caballi]
MMTPGAKKLTDPPENLKEAIDWVLRVSGGDSNNDDSAIKGLSEELIKLLDKDGSTLASEVNGIFSKARSGLQTATQKDAREAFMLNAYLSDISPYGRTLIEEELDHLKKALQKDVESPGGPSGCPITNLADGLKKFIGYQDSGGMPNGRSGIGSSNYESSYKSASESWNSLTTDQHRDCAAILLGIMPVLYFGLSYLYWWCEGTGGWAQHKIDGSGRGQEALKNFLEKVGFEAGKLNQSKKGSDIVQYINTGFNELTSRTNASSNDHPMFFGEHQKALETLPNSSSPITSLYLLSYYYITYPFHEVQSTSPATPSFAGYSGLSALAGGAYGFNLGGLGTLMSTLLA